MNSEVKPDKGPAGTWRVRLETLNPDVADDVLADWDVTCTCGTGGTSQWKIKNKNRRDAYQSANDDCAQRCGLP